MSTQPTVELNLAVTARYVHPDGISVGIQADQQKINRRSTAETVLDRFTEVVETLQSSAGGQSIVASVGCTALMLRIERTEVVSHHLEITGRSVGLVGHTLAVATVLGFHPTIDRVLHVEHGSCMGATTHGTEWNPKCVSNGMGKTPISARRHIEKMKATLEQKRIELLSALTARSAGEGVI